MSKSKTVTFGAQEYDEGSVLHFPEGMLGFSRFTRYILIEEEGMRPFRWLQSLDDQELAFPVIDPHLIMKDYSSSIPAHELRKLDIENPSELLTLVVAIIPEDPMKASVNLKAPLLINHKKMISKQIVLAESDFDVRTPVIEGK